jgi:hypothetical protein
MIKAMIQANKFLLEVMSGHGNSEEFRDIASANFLQNGEMSCPEPTDDFFHVAGKQVRCRKRNVLVSDAECSARVELAKKYTLAGGPYTNMVFPEAAPEEWLNCDQCTDCFKPAFNYRPKQSAQYALAISNFDSGDEKSSKI